MVCNFYIWSLCLGAVASAANSGVIGHPENIITLPLARPQIESFSHDDAGKVIEPQNVVQLSDPTGSIFGKNGIPRGIDEAAEAMQVALPREYRLALLASYGWTIDGKPFVPARTDLRSVDLSQFLYDRWVHAHPRSRLAKEFRCLVSFEGDISAFELMIAAKARQIFEDEGLRIDPISRSASTTYYAGVMSASVAERACRSLVARGWSPDDRQPRS